MFFNREFAAIQLIIKVCRTLQSKTLIVHRIVPDIEKPTAEEIIVSETKDDSAQENKQKRQEKQKVKKPKAEQESLIIEDLPLFVMIFMVLLVIFKLVAQATIDLPPYAVTAVSMASAISVIFVKNRF